MPPRLAWLHAVVLMVVNFVALAALSFQPQAGSQTLAVAFPPWWDTRHTFLAAASADVAIVRETAFPSLLVVKIDDNASAIRLRAAGAWLILDPVAVAACINN